MKLLLATTNPHKLLEIQAILGMTVFEYLSFNDFNNIPEVIEDGDTFEANAVIKAKAYSQHFKLPVLADDSGLQVDALNGAPGVESARYCGVDTPYDVKMRFIIDNVLHLPLAQRTARFVCVMAYTQPDGFIITTRGTMEGLITDIPRGANGFGYDPCFFQPDLNKTNAELTATEKNQRSHRGMAVRLMKENLELFR